MIMYKILIKQKVNQPITDYRTQDINGNVKDDI